MRMSNLMKKLKKQLRSRKRWISLASLYLLIGFAGQTLPATAEAGASGTAGSVLSGIESTAQLRDPAANRAEALEAIAQGANSRQVLHKRIYVCGEETEALGSMTKRELLDYASRHPELIPELAADGTVVFTETVEDLSPGCKQNAFFGVDAGGNLSLFDGAPDEQRVIRTFFQLNVEDLKSSLPPDAWNQLNAGIRVKDLDEFNSVLSTFSDFTAAHTPDSP